MWAECPGDRPTFVQVAEGLVVLRSRVNQPTQLHGVELHEQQVCVAVGDREAQECADADLPKKLQMQFHLQPATTPDN